MNTQDKEVINTRDLQHTFICRKPKYIMQTRPSHNTPEGIEPVEPDNSSHVRHRTHSVRATRPLGTDRPNTKETTKSRKNPQRLLATVQETKKMDPIRKNFSENFERNMTKPTQNTQKSTPKTAFLKVGPLKTLAKVDFESIARGKRTRNCSNTEHSDNSKLRNFTL